MWFRKNKIKETKKRGMYGRRYEASNYSSWDNMSFIEKFAFLGLPCMLCFIFYMMCDIIHMDMIWYIRLLISVCGVALCIGLITGIVNYFTGENW